MGGPPAWRVGEALPPPRHKNLTSYILLKTSGPKTEKITGDWRILGNDETTHDTLSG